MLENWDAAQSRLLECEAVLGRLPAHTRVDLRRMARSVRDLLTQADRERVECRRRRCVTTRFQQLMAQVEQSLTNLEGHVTFATLMRKPDA